MVTLMLVLAGLSWGYVELDSRRLQTSAALVDLRARDAAQRKDFVVPSQETRPVDYTERLPEAPVVPGFLQELQRACTSSGVLLSSIVSTDRPATAEQLGHAELTIAMRGSYLSLKLVLREVMSRYESTVLSRLSLKRAAGSQEVEASATVLLLARPARAEEVAASRGAALP